MDAVASGVRIRPGQAEDAEALHALVQASQPALAAWLPWCRHGYGIDDARGWTARSMAAWDARSEFPFAVVDEDDVLLGGTGLSRLDPSRRSANLGYWTGTPFVGRGFATAAARQVAHFGFDELSLQRIEIRALPDNAASLGVARRLGATREGIVHNALHHDGQLHDAWLYSLNPDDLP